MTSLPPVFLLLSYHRGKGTPLFYAYIYSVSFFNSNVSATFLLELLVSLVADQMDETATKRLDLLNPYFERNKR